MQTNTPTLYGSGPVTVTLPIKAKNVTPNWFQWGGNGAAIVSGAVTHSYNLTGLVYKNATTMLLKLDGADYNWTGNIGVLHLTVIYEID